jgi:cytidyltransferase-like protein
MNIVVVSGGFDPLHSGHISYLNSAKQIGDMLIVALNSDQWLIKKKGKFFMPFLERRAIIQNLRSVDEVIGFEDDDLGSCINALEIIKKKYAGHQITFCNGGDRNSKNIPELQVEGINFKYEVGGTDKKNSSSDILNNYSFSHESRIWGKFYNLFSENNILVKKIIVDPYKGMSFQKHMHRNEIWLISKGACVVNYSEIDSENFKTIELNYHDYFHVIKEAWHQIINPYKEPCHIVEIQYGSLISEEDIERIRFYEGNQTNDNN